MALAHTILTILIDQPASGYDISKCFEEGISCFWNASQQQIYRELTKMSKEGLISHTTVPQAGKPDKKIYSLTDSGKQKLGDWCLEPTEPTAIREDLLVRILAIPFVSKDSVLNELKRRQRLHRQRFEHFTAKQNFYLEHGYFENERRSPTDKYHYLTLLRGIRFEASWVAWCDDVLAVLEAEESGQAIAD